MDNAVDVECVKAVTVEANAVNKLKGGVDIAIDGAELMNVVSPVRIVVDIDSIDVYINYFVLHSNLFWMIKVSGEERSG